MYKGSKNGLWLYRYDADKSSCMVISGADAEDDDDCETMSDAEPKRRAPLKATPSDKVIEINSIKSSSSSSSGNSDEDDDDNMVHEPSRRNVCSGNDIDRVEKKTCNINHNDGAVNTGDGNLIKNLKSIQKGRKRIYKKNMLKNYVNNDDQDYNNNSYIDRRKRRLGNYNTRSCGSFTKCMQLQRTADSKDDGDNNNNDDNADKNDDDYDDDAELMVKPVNKLRVLGSDSENIKDDEFNADSEDEPTYVRKSERTYTKIKHCVEYYAKLETPVMSMPESIKLSDLNFKSKIKFNESLESEKTNSSAVGLVKKKILSKTKTVRNFIDSIIPSKKSQIDQKTKWKYTAALNKLITTPMSVLTSDHYKADGGYGHRQYVGMISIHDALHRIDKNNVRFVKSILGDRLRLYSERRTEFDPIRLEGVNSKFDNASYELCYGYIPVNMSLDFQFLIETVTHVRHNEAFDFLEGEVELILMALWQLTTTDLKNYDETTRRCSKKLIMTYFFDRLRRRCVSRNKSIKDYYYNCLFTLFNYANFDDENTVTASSLYCMKYVFNMFSTIIDDQDNMLWVKYFKMFNLHHIRADHTLNILERGREQIFKWIFTITSTFFKDDHEHSILTDGGRNKQSSSTNERKNTVIKQSDIRNMLSFLFAKDSQVPVRLCVKLDNLLAFFGHWFAELTTNIKPFIGVGGKYAVNEENANMFFSIFENQNSFPRYLGAQIIKPVYPKYVTLALKNYLENLYTQKFMKFKVAVTVQDQVLSRLVQMVHEFFTYITGPVLLRCGRPLTITQWATLICYEFDKFETTMITHKSLPAHLQPLWMGNGKLDDKGYNPTNYIDHLENYEDVLHLYDRAGDDEDEPVAKESDDEFGPNVVLVPQPISRRIDHSTEFGISKDEQSEFESDGETSVHLDEDVKRRIQARLMRESLRLVAESKTPLFTCEIAEDVTIRINRIISSLCVDSKNRGSKRKLNTGNDCAADPTVITKRKKLDATEREWNNILQKHLKITDPNHNTTYDGTRTFGVIKNPDLPRGQRSGKGCILCADPKNTTWNIVASPDHCVSTCVSCVFKLYKFLKFQIHEFESLRNYLVKRIDYNYKSPLFPELATITTVDSSSVPLFLHLPKFNSLDELYYCTYNKLSVQFGKKLNLTDLTKKIPENLRCSEFVSVKKSVKKQKTTIKKVRVGKKKKKLIVILPTSALHGPLL